MVQIKEMLRVVECERWRQGRYVLWARANRVLCRGQRLNLGELLALPPGKSARSWGFCGCHALMNMVMLSDCPF